MTAKKKVQEKKLPRARHKIEAIMPPTLADDADALHVQACEDKMNSFTVMLHESPEARNYVAVLAQNYERVCLALAEAHALLKEPNVAHAVNVANRLKALEAQIERLDDLQSDLNRHESEYSHEYRRDYY